MGTRTTRQTQRRRALGFSVPLAVVLLASAPSCTLTATDYGTTCHFAGENGACGKCIATNCQALVNACCADSTCRQENEPNGGCAGIGASTTGTKLYTMGKLDACASGKSCFDLEVDAKGAGIAACTRQHCSDTCDLRREPVVRVAEATDCSYSSSRTSCDCKVPGTPDVPAVANDVSCSQGERTDVVCCADLKWPAAGSSCTCTLAVCIAYSNGCTCELESSNYNSSNRVEACTLGACCEDDKGECSCNETACDAQYNERGRAVKACTPAEVRCGDTKRRVTSCSAPKAEE